MASTNKTSSLTNTRIFRSFTESYFVESLEKSSLICKHFSKKNGERHVHKDDCDTNMSDTEYNWFLFKIQVLALPPTENFTYGQNE